MKKFFSVIIALTLVLCSVSSAFACAGIYVGNDAAENGSTYFARSEDFGSDYTKVFGVAPSRNLSEGEVYEDAYGFKMSYAEFGLTGNTHKYTYIKDSPEVVDDYGYSQNPVSPADGEAYAEAGINDSGVFVSATVSTNYMATWYGTECASMKADPLVDTGICEISLGSILLAHADSAKDGVDLLAAIIDKYGAGECNSLVIGDQNETWFFEIVSGHQYAAIKMPKDKQISIQPNIMLLGVIDVNDTENVVASADLVSLAERKGFLVMEGGKINVAKSYAEVNSGAPQYQRYYQGLFYINQAEAATYDSVLDQDKLASFNNNENSLPLLNTPDRTLSTQDIFKLQATRGEGSKFDANTTDSYAIGNQYQSECHVFETRKNMAPQLATIQWQAMGPAEYSIYIPYYSALLSKVHGSYDVTSLTSVDHSMFWVFSDIYQLCSKDRTNNGAAVKAYFEKYQASLIEQQKAVDAEMVNLYAEDPEAAAKMADNLGLDIAQQTYDVAVKVLAELEAYDAQEEKAAPMALPESITNILPVYSIKHASAPPADPVPEGKARLLAGDESVADEDALVLTIVGDGFSRFEQDKFFTYAQNTADYIMNTSPWDEFTKNVKIYGIGVASNESGVRGETASSVEEAQNDTLDTYFQASYWSYGTERMVYIDEDGEAKLKALMKEYCQASEFQIMLVNSKKVGGAGGEKYCVFSIDPDVYECAVHELGHTVGNLADEYWTSTYANGTYANISKESDPEKVSWSRFIGKNGIGVYEHSGGGEGYYRPSQNCKMQYLGEQYELCEVCKEQMRKRISQLSNVAVISFQTYADEFYVNPDGTRTDMRPYFIIRQGEKSITGDQLGENVFTLTYTDEEGNVIDGIPNEYGTYKIQAEFNGNETFAACTSVAEYTINYPNYITLTADSKTYDGEPICIDYSVSTLEEGTYDVEVSYTGNVDNTYSKPYDSSKAPSLAGDYEVTVTVKEKGTEDIITQKSKSFAIDCKVTAIADNNDVYNYPGASPDTNNKSVIIVGEGFTAEEQEKFEGLAQKFVDRILDTEPFKEAVSYFNFYTVETVSEKSGIGKEAGNTYFAASYDENGTIVPNYYGSVAGCRIAYYDVEPWYQQVFVIVNDRNVKQSVTDSSYYDRVTYCTPDDAGADYAAQSFLNYLTGYDSAYVPQTAEEKAEQREALLDYALYSYYGLDYAPILIDAYKADFTANGMRVDITDYIHTYIGSTEVPASEMEYNITYYTDNNGAVGKVLNGAPFTAGTYHAFVETVTNDEYDWGPIYDNWKDPARKVDLSSLGLGERYLAKTRNWTTFTIKSAPKNPSVTDEDNEAENQTPTATIAEGVQATKLIARSEKTSNGIKISWTKSKGYKVDYYEVFRSTKRYSGFGKAAFYTTKNAENPAKTWYVNTKNLKNGARYYYKVRGVRVLDGKKVYTQWSTKAWRTVK